MTTYETHIDIRVRVMAGRQAFGCWRVNIRWDTPVDAWRDLDLWTSLQGLFDKWPFSEGKKHCRCRRRLGVYTEVSPEGLERCALLCELYQITVTLEAVPDIGSGGNIRVVSVNLKAVSCTGPKIQD